MGRVGRTIVPFGGLKNFEKSNATWTWNGVQWTEQHPAAAPSPREEHAMASFAGGVLLFGGLSNDIPGKPPGDTRVWDGPALAQVFPADAAPARRGDSLVGRP